jgi:glucokinase
VVTMLIDIGGTKFSLASSEDIKVRKTWKVADFPTAQKIQSALAAELFALIESGVELDAIGVSFGGPFDFENQRVRRSVHVSGWEEFSFKDWAKDNFDVPCLADNDANLGALGEYSLRSEVSSLLYITLSTGIGAGIVIDGNVYRGKSDLAGEIGHISIDPAGPVDDSGNVGTLERLCSGYWIKRDYGKDASEVIPGILDQYTTNLSRGLDIAIKLLNPALVVLGGGITKIGNPLLATLQEKLSNTLEISQTQLELSKLGADNVLLGARELVGN